MSREILVAFLFLLFSSLSLEAKTSCVKVLQLESESFGGKLHSSEIKKCGETGGTQKLQIGYRGRPPVTVSLPAKKYAQYSARMKEILQLARKAKPVASNCHHSSSIDANWEGEKLKASFCSDQVDGNEAELISNLIRDLYYRAKSKK